MNQSESEVWEDDGEAALFNEEMRQEAPRLQAMLLQHALKTGQSYPVEIDYHSVRAMVKARNDMAALLREYASRHPEDADLARRAKRYL